MARNCIILGSGRSGTSLTAGLLAQAGYFMGGSVDEAGLTPANPKGQFEDPEINRINEDLLGPPMRAYRHSLFNQLFRPRQRSYVKLQYYQRWLAALPPSVTISGDPAIVRRIESLTAHEPYCFKDPRFSYTLGVWRPLVRDAVFICVFRHPAVTAASIVTECATASYLSDVQMDHGRALRIWYAMYRYMLQVHYPAGGDWMFVHYDQLMDGSRLDELEQRLDVRVDRGFADSNLKRSQACGAVPTPALSLYRRLCDFAGYREQELAA